MKKKKQKNNKTQGNQQITAIEDLSNSLQVSEKVLTKTLKSTIIKGKNREATDEEFVSFVIVANKYKLNPITKEIFAFPDNKGGGIVPIVSTDGWNKLMTKAPDYSHHYYEYADNFTEITEKAKPCPEWIEIHIVKKSGKEVVVREYLDECYNGNKKRRDGSYYASPWDTHTKRMLRHKTKIQGAREAFGFGGIYDEDEAERIKGTKIVEEQEEIKEPKAKDEQAKEDTEKENAEEAEVVEEPEKKEDKNKQKIIKKINKKEQQEEISETEQELQEESDNNEKKFIKGQFEEMKKKLGKEDFYRILGVWGHEKIDDIQTKEQMRGVYKAMQNLLKQKEEEEKLK